MQSEDKECRVDAAGSTPAAVLYEQVYMCEQPRLVYIVK